jgi:lysyl-tRNA synthetase class I
MSDVYYFCAKCRRILEAEIIEEECDAQTEVVKYTCPIHGEMVIIEFNK